jgi:hypothetical protein
MKIINSYPSNVIFHLYQNTQQILILSSVLIKELYRIVFIFMIDVLPWKLSFKYFPICQLILFSFIEFPNLEHHHLPWFLDFNHKIEC